MFWRYRQLLAVRLGVVMMAAACLSGALHASDDVEDELVALERAQAAAVVSLDFAALDRVYADDFRFTHGTGVVQNKTEWLEALRAGQPVYVSREHELLEVEPHGDIVVTYGQLRIHSRLDGADNRFRARYVRVYAKRSGRWQLVSHRTVEQTAEP